MIETTSRNIRFLSKMGARGVLGQAVFDMANEGFEFYALSADLVRASGFERLRSKYPDKVINVGIAEQNLIGVAAGLSRDGTPVIVTTWAPFATLRCADQIKNYLGYMGLDVKIIGLDSGMHQNSFGYSHYGLEDIALMRSIPNIKIICPSDGLEIYRALEAAIKTDGSAYIRLTGGTVLPIINKDANYKFEIGKATVLKEGTDVLFVANGFILSEVLKSIDRLEAQGISCKVLNMHTVKPVDKEALLNKLSDFKLIVTVEEHSVYGGLGSTVAEAIAAIKNKPRQVLIGVNDLLPKPGDHNFLLEQCGLKHNQISDYVMRALES